jgi:hypothetical protein
VKPLARLHDRPLVSWALDAASTSESPLKNDPTDSSPPTTSAMTMTKTALVTSPPIA